MNATQIYRRTPKGVLTNLYSKMKDRNIKKGFGKLDFSLIRNILRIKSF